MSKKISKVIVYYDDGTFEEVLQAGGAPIEEVKIKTKGTPIEYPEIQKPTWPFMPSPLITPHNPHNRDLIVD